MTLGREHEQPARGQHRLTLGGDLFVDTGDRGVALGAFGQVLQLVADAEFLVAAELDVGAAARHVRRDRDRAGAARLRDDMRFAFVETRVEHAMRHAVLFKEGRQQLGLFDRHGADEHRLATLVRLADRLGDRAELVGDILVEFILVVDARDRAVGRDVDDIHLVNVEEFGGFGRRGAGHARKLGVHAEIILEGDRRERLVLGLDLHAFLRLDRLVQAIGPAPAVHHAAGELVDDHDLTVLDDIVGVDAEHLDRLQRLIDVMHDLRVLDVVEIVALKQARGFEQALDMLGAVFGQVDRLGLFVLLIIILGQVEDDLVDADIKLGLVVGRARDDQRGARFVDQDRIDLVDDAEVEGAVDHLLAVELHIVAEVIEAQLVVRRIGDVAVIGVAALRLIKVRDDDPGCQAQEAIDGAHPFGVARREIVVDRDDMDALAFERVEVAGQSRHQRLAFTRRHFGDLAAVEDDAADHLHVEMAHAERADRRLAHRRKGFGQDVVERLAGREPVAECLRLCLQSGIVERLHRGLERVDLVDDLADGGDITVVGRAEQALG